MVQQICRDVPRRVKGSTDIFFEVHRSESDQTGRCDALTRFDLGPCKKVFGGRLCVHTGVRMSGVRWGTLGMTCDLIVILWRGKRCVCGEGGRSQNGQKSWS